MADQPLVSVTMPVFNGEKYLGQTIESILNQTYSNLELVIVNDASTDGTKELILSIQDPRIRYFENETNSGIVKTRNNCLPHTRGKYIAIIDADDIALPDRLEKQVAFMEANPEYGFCGTYYDVIDSDGKFIVSIEVPTVFSEINTFLLFNNCFCHSSVMVQRDLLLENKFVEGWDLMEEYELAYRLTGLTKLTNLPVCTTKYRVHGKNSSIKRSEKMQSLRKLMDARILDDLHIPYSERELLLHANFVNSNFPYFRNNSDFRELENWLVKVYRFLENNDQYVPDVVARIFIKRWILLFYMTRRFSYKFFYTRLFLNFRSKYLKYLIEFIGDRFRKQFRVA